MAYFRLIPQNILRSADLSTAGAVNPGSVRDVIQDRKATGVRSAGASLTVTGVFPDAVNVSAVVCPATNMTTAGVLSVRLFSDAVGLSPILTATALGVLPGGPSEVASLATFPYGLLRKAAVWLSSPVACRRIEMTFTDPTYAAQGGLDVSLLCVGEHWTCPVAPSWGLQTGWDYVGEEAERTRSGDLVSAQRPGYETANFALQALSRASRMEVYRTLRRVGEKKCVMALALDDVPDHDCLMFGVVKPSEFSLVGYQGTDVSLDVQGW